MQPRKCQRIYIPEIRKYHDPSLGTNGSQIFDIFLLIKKLNNVIELINLHICGPKEIVKQ